MAEHSAAKLKKGRIKIEEDWPEKVAANLEDFLQRGQIGAKLLERHWYSFISKSQMPSKRKNY